MVKKDTDNLTLDKRDDLIKKWSVSKWFTKSDVDAKYLKKIFLELFMSLYDDLTEKFSPKKRDELFIKFMNDVFTTALDNYKWYESEKQKKDIGLAKALEEISMCAWYINLLTTYSKYYDKQ